MVVDMTSMSLIMVASMLAKDRWLVHVQTSKVAALLVDIFTLVYPAYTPRHT